MVEPCSGVCGVRGVLRKVPQMLLAFAGKRLWGGMLLARKGLVQAGFLGSVGRWQTRSEASENHLEGSGFDVFSFTRTSEVRLLVMNGSGESVLEGPLLVFRKRKVPRVCFLRFRRVPEGSKRWGEVSLKGSRLGFHLAVGDAGWMRILLTAICVMCYCAPTHRKALRRPYRDGLKGYFVGRSRADGRVARDGQLGYSRYPTTSFEEARIPPDSISFVGSSDEKIGMELDNRSCINCTGTLCSC